MSRIVPDISIVVDSSEVVRALDPNKITNDLYVALGLATGLVHRTLLSLKREGTPSNLQGVLPVVSGRLAGSFLMAVEKRGNDMVGSVTSNVEYGAVVDARRRFLQATVDRSQRGINDILSRVVR
jgi:hypothetical protein